MIKVTGQLLRYCLLTAMVATISPVHAQTGVNPAESQLRAPQKPYSPYVGRKDAGSNFAEGVYWGDTHLHTSYSTDAGMIGNTLPPETAYRFALGEEITTSTGMRARLIRPLDFLVVADHAANLGLAPMIAESNPEVLRSPMGKKLHDLVKAGKGYDAFSLWGLEGIAKNTDIIDNPKMNRTAWDREIKFAEQFNDPANFTAFIGYEWTSINTPDAPSNLHRVVVFKDGADKAGQVVPFSTFDSYDPEDLWDYMADYEKKTGGSVLAIPHNGNLSNGLMFATERLNGRKIDKKYAEKRMRWEPIYEVTQIKGDGETHPRISVNDEFADYGTWDKADIAGLKAKTDDMLPHEYARSALQIGLQMEKKLGVNPFKFGMIGSTDAHTSMASTREENYWGKMASAEPSADRWEHYVIRAIGGDNALSTYEYETLASGLAGVWARDNTREALFEAMQKKETYATTGTRIVVRFFGGWDYEESDVFRTDAAARGYASGVPMGGDLPAQSANAKAPRFLVGAMKDPWSGNLDRIQIVKGWVDKKGQRQEKVYDVAVSDGRKIGADGRAHDPVGNTVEGNEFLNTIGEPELRALWIDPDFDPDVPAVYYARVIEIPTPTWQAHDMAYFGTQMPESVPRWHQERAYTSPIWYTGN
jgi:hypothetical protein